MIMIDHLIENDETHTCTDFSIPANNVFVKNNVFLESGLIENMAQTAAAGGGYAYQQSKTTQPITYIGSISKLSIKKYPVVGDLIKTKTEILTSALNITLIRGTCFVGEELIAECEMKMVVNTA